MANKIWPFSAAGQYTFDPGKIDVIDGLAQLLEDLTNIYGHWHLNESSGIIAADSSGNARHGDLIGFEDIDWKPGKLNNCLEFDGINKYVNLGNIASFERNEPFSYECWLRTTETQLGFLMTRMLGFAPYAGMQIYVRFGKMEFHLIHNYSNNLISVKSASNVNDDLWHHFVATYDGHSQASGAKIYIDNFEQSVITKNSLSLSMISPENFHLGARSGGGSKWHGFIDEVVIYDRVLTPDEVAFRYNLGAGREYNYSVTKPTIKPKNSWTPSSVLEWTGFVETLGPGNQGNVAYQLSDDDGANWKYWNGAAWIITVGADYNDAATVHANIDQFPGGNDKILFRAFLISNGSQKVELDSLEISATLGLPPVVYAGSDKSCFDHEQKKPFSDCTITDPDGDIENSTAWYDIEGSGWTQILKGGYGTLQEAVRNFQYLFDHTGQVQCELKIIDEQGRDTADEMIMTVQKYAVTFNIKNEEGNHLTDILCNFGDEEGWQTKTSPFIYEFGWKATWYICVFNKSGYIIQSIPVLPSIHSENVALQALCVDPAEVADAVWDEEKAGHVAEGSFGKLTGFLQDIKDETDEIPYIVTNTNKIQAEIINKKDEYKADVSSLADIKAETDKISSLKTIIELIEQVEVGEWKIEEDVLYFMDPNGQVTIASFQLHFDKKGNVIRRTRIS